MAEERNLVILTQMRKIIRSLNIENKRIQKEFDLTIPQLLTLRHLQKSPKYVSNAKLIRDELLLNASTVSGILQRLEKKELIAKLSKTGDKRITRITLTAEGLKKLEAAPLSLFEKLDNGLDQLPKRQLAKIEESFKILVQILDAEDLDASPLLTTEEFI